MKFCEKAECMLTVISVVNVAVMTAIGLTDGLKLTELFFIAIQIAAIAAVYFFTHYSKPQTMTSSDQILRLEAHERTHEQKRHYQVALALMELGEQDKAVSYIDKIMKEIA